MTKKTLLISEDIFLRAEAGLKDLGKEGKISNKLQAIVSSYRHGITQVSEILDISRASIHRWVRLFQKKGIDGLRDADKPPRSKLNAEQKNIIRQWIEAKPATTIKELGLKIEKEFGIALGKSSIHRALVSLDFSYITGRPKHHKSDDLKQEDFKKNSRI